MFWGGLYSGFKADTGGGVGFRFRAFAKMPGLEAVDVTDLELRKKAVLGKKEKEMKRFCLNVIAGS